MTIRCTTCSGCAATLFKVFITSRSGIPVEDTRLTTEPGYAWERRSDRRTSTAPAGRLGWLLPRPAGLRRCPGCASMMLGLGNSSQAQRHAAHDELGGALHS